ncbi:MAG TPA: hypothetical protein DE117_05295 [Fervidobacterium sp.]|nr:hypothetical protein [Fervidobacterium sp.]
MISKELYGVKFYIDKEDEHLLKEFKWYKEKQQSGYYFMATYKQKNGIKIKIKLHRLIAGATKIIDGVVYNSGLLVDHIDRNTLNNTKSNLRMCTRSQNAMNSKVGRDNSSGYKGVSWKKDKQKWKAYLNINGKQVHLGYYDNIEDAVLSRINGARLIFGEFFAEGVEGVRL